MKILKPYFLIKLMIQKIQSIKDLFTLEIQSGNEIYIPNELSQDKLPSSFRYYDFILNYVMDNMSHDTNELVRFRNDLKLSFFRNQKNILDTLMTQKNGLSKKQDVQLPN